MFASTKSARNLLKIAIESCNSHAYQSWTDKTTDNDQTRRSVSFHISSIKAQQVLENARQIFEDFGYTESIPKLTVSETFDRSGGNTYIRVIAQMSKG